MQAAATLAEPLPVAPPVAPPQFPLSPFAGTVAMQDVLMTVMNQHVISHGAFHLLIFTDAGQHSVETAHSVQGLIEKIQSLQGQDVTIFPFMGFRLTIAKDPRSPALRYLRTPYGDLPLFAPAKTEELVDDDGFLGTTPPEPDIPTREDVELLPDQLAEEMPVLPAEIPDTVPILDASGAMSKTDIEADAGPPSVLTAT